MFSKTEPILIKNISYEAKVTYQQKNINTNVWNLLKLCLSFMVPAELQKEKKKKKKKQERSARKKLFYHVYDIKEI